MMTTPHSQAAEATLVGRARGGDQKAFRSLYDAHVSPLFRFLSQFSFDREETREWVQRAFINAFGRLDQFDGRSTFSTWLFTIGLNEMRSDRRRKNIKVANWKSKSSPAPSISKHRTER